MVCCVYNSVYCKVLTITIYDMKYESTKVQCVMWTKLNQVMLRFGLANPNFKGFMVDNAHANWNVVHIMYGFRDVSMKMVNKERTCLFHWT
jgi:hypothetical protein